MSSHSRVGSPDLKLLGEFPWVSRSFLCFSLTDWRDLHFEGMQHWFSRIRGSQIFTNLRQENIRNPFLIFFFWSFVCFKFFSITFEIFPQTFSSITATFFVYLSFFLICLLYLTKLSKKPRKLTISWEFFKKNLLHVCLQLVKTSVSVKILKWSILEILTTRWNTFMRLYAFN